MDNKEKKEYNKYLKDTQKKVSDVTRYKWSEEDYKFK